MPPIVHEVVQSPGQPLDDATRTFFEPRLGHDFSRVRVHTDPRASESARAVDALAYTVGRDVVFGVGQYAPQTTRGRRLLAHELTHVVQQQHADLNIQRLATVSPSDSPAEREADSLSHRVAAGQAVAVSSGMSSSALQREPAGGCGICYGGPQFAGIEAHKVVQLEFEIMHTLGLIEFPFTSPTDDNGRLDLAIASPTGFYIGEIKPANPEGYAQGFSDIAFYKAAIEAAYPGKKVGYLRTLIPPAIFPNPQVPGCPLQTLFVNPPINGVFGYECDPPYSKLVWRPECKCTKKPPPPTPIRVPKEVEVKRRVKARDKDKDPVRVRGPEVLVPVAITALMGLMLKQALKKSTGPVGAVASLAALAIVLSTTDAEAKIGLEGEDPLFALFDMAEQNGTPVPDELKAAIEKSPELKAKINEALKKGNVGEAQKELNRQMLKIINDNIDQFSSEDLEALASITEVAGDSLPDGKATVETIRKAAESAKQREQAGVGATEGKDEGAKAEPVKEAGEGKEKVPEENVPAGAEITPALRDRLQKSAPSQRLYKAMIGMTGTGPVVTGEVLEQFLDLVEPYGLSDAEVSALIAKLQPNSGKSADEIFAGLKDELDQMRGEKAAPEGKVPSEGRVTPEPEGGKVATPDAAAAPKETAPEAAPPGTAKETKPEATKAPPKPKGTKKKKGEKESVSIDEAVDNIVKHLAGYTSLSEGEHQMTLLDPPLVLNKSTTAFFAKRLNKVLFGGYITITPTKKLSNNQWIVTIHAGSLVASETKKHARWPNKDIESEVTMID